MKQYLPRSVGNVTRCFAACLAIASASLHGQTITNTSFEANTFTVWPGYASGNSGAITDWTLSNNTRTGLNPAAGNPFADNGAIPAGSNVAFLQAGGSGAVTMSQTVSGLTIGTKYHVEFRVNARNATGPFLQFSTDTGEPAVSAQVTPVGGSNPYKYVGFDFTATNTSNVINIANTINSGDHTLLVDDVTITTSTGAWSFGPWQDDATSGVDSAYLYTHAVNFNSNAVANINGVPFIPREVNIAGRFSVTGLNAVFGNRTPNNVTGNSNGLAKDFRYNGNTGITLDNLKPNTQYVFTVYGIGFDVSEPRAATFSSNLTTEKFTANLNQYGQGNGMRVNYTYTTDALGSPVTINYPATGAGTFHTSGFSNREATVNATPSPWSTVAWSNDATSGIDGSYLYTHAYNFGNASGANVNGINFTGIAGTNPSAGNYTSVLGVVHTDVNNITGYGAALAKDFVYGGMPEVHNLTGLTPGKNYVFTLYSVGWEAAGNRFAALVGGKGDGITAIDQDQFGDNNGIRIEYRYTADSTGTLKVTSSEIQSAASAAVMHIYAMSNRETDPLVSTPPTITEQPTGTTLGVGKDFALRVGVVGSPTITYQWKLGGTDISGATDPVLLLEDIDYAQAGNYTCVITNSFGTVSSDVATLVVLDNIPGLFNTGVGVDGQPLNPGATDPHYTLITNPDNTSSTLALVQSGLPGAWLPNSITSRWIGPREISSGAAGQSANAGEGLGKYVYRTSVNLTNFDLSTVSIRGKWACDNEGIAVRVNGVAVTGVDYLVGNTFNPMKSFEINSVNAPSLVTGVNTIDFVINNADAVTGFTGLRIQDFQGVGLIAPNTAPFIAVQPVSVVAKHNQSAKFAVGASGSATLTYQWYFQGDVLPSETDPILLVSALDPTVAGDYKVRVSNGTGFVDSSIATLSVPNAAPVAVENLATINEDTPLVFNAADLLANDTDADLDIIGFTSIAATSVQGGTVTEVSGTITYTPPANFNGLDAITYTINDGIWGGTHSGSIVITVNPVTEIPPSPMTIALAAGVMNGSFVGTPGVSYTIERSTTLTEGSWTALTTTVAPLSGIVNVTDPSPPAGKAFYRITYPE